MLNKFITIYIHIHLVCGFYVAPFRESLESAGGLPCDKKLKFGDKLNCFLLSGGISWKTPQKVVSGR